MIEKKSHSTLTINFALTVACLSAALWGHPGQAQQGSVLIAPDWGVPAHGVHWATVDLLEPVCRPGSLNPGGSPVPLNALEDLRERVESVRGLREARCAGSGDYHGVAEPCMVAPCVTGASRDALDSLVASDLVVHGQVVDIKPAFDFSSLRAASIILIDVWASYPEKTLRGVSQVSFPMNEGKLDCDGVTLCTSRSFAVADAAPEPKIGQELLVGATRYREESQSLGVMEARIFPIDTDGEAGPLSYVSIYSPSSFSRSVALATLELEFGQ